GNGAVDCQSESVLIKGICTCTYGPQAEGRLTPRGTTGPARPAETANSRCSLSHRRVAWSWPRRVAAAPRVLVRSAGLLRARGPDRRLDILLFLRRRQHRGHAERLHPQFSAPPLRVVQVLVFLLFDFLVGLLE